MEGRPDNPGLNARTLRLLFELSRERAAEWQFEVGEVVPPCVGWGVRGAHCAWLGATQIEISLLEVYNEQILDLLAKTPLTKCVHVCPLPRFAQASRCCDNL